MADTNGFEQKLERLTERVDALAESVELAHSDFVQHREEFLQHKQEFRQHQAEMRAILTGLAATDQLITIAVQRLVAMVEDHGRRLSALEGRQ